MRWNTFKIKDKEVKIQRDLYSAFLLMNVNDDLESINNDKCNKIFNSFCKLHDIEIKRLKKLDNNLSSIGIK